jgi:hypothetical protein
MQVTSHSAPEANSSALLRPPPHDAMIDTWVRATSRCR